MILQSIIFFSLEDRRILYGGFVQRPSSAVFFLAVWNQQSGASFGCKKYMYKYLYNGYPQTASLVIYVRRASLPLPSLQRYSPLYSTTLSLSLTDQARDIPIIFDFKASLSLVEESIKVPLITSSAITPAKSVSVLSTENRAFLWYARTPLIL